VSEKKRSRRFGIAGGALLLALLGSAIGPGSAAAASQIRFGSADYESLAIGSNCVDGFAASASVVNLTWRASNGALKAKVNVPSTYGSWRYCDPSASLAIGDTLKANDGVHARTFTVPLVTLDFNRASHIASGHVPASTALKVWYFWGYSDYWPHEDATSDAQGNWQVLIDGLPGGGELMLQWFSAKGDMVTVRQTAPSINVTVGKSRIAGTGPHGQTLKFNLRDGLTNGLKGTATVQIDDEGSFAGEFRDSGGHPVTVETGDRVKALQVASDLNWIVPEVVAVANVADDTVTGSCPPTNVANGYARIRVVRTGRTRGFALRGVNGTDGAWFVKFRKPDGFLFDGANIKHGDKIVVDCVLDTGDVVTSVVPVP
jgi:hypothetical protein